MLLKYLNFQNKLSFLLILICFNGFASNNQLPNTISKNAQVSLLTCNEGDEIYSLFGHSAIRIYDIDSQINIVFNWGMFDWPEDQFDFGYQFAKGKLKYYMTIQSFNEFMYDYENFNREVYEQVLDLDLSQKQLLYEKLLINYLPKNRVYKYDFFYDNCSSRIRDMFQSVLRDKLILYQHKDANMKSFREIIDVNLASQPWLDMGIDLVLGSRIDVMATNQDLMFLPKYMEQIIDSSYVLDVNGVRKPFVIRKNQVLNSNKSSEQESMGTGLYFWILLSTTLALIVFRINYATISWIAIILFITGLLGILLIFMWIGTDHQATKSNYNVLWANPCHLITFISLFIPRLIKRFKIYYLSMTIVLFSLVLFWIMLPQEFHPSTSPIILSLTMIYFFLFSESKKLINTKAQDSSS